MCMVFLMMVLVGGLGSLMVALFIILTDLVFLARSSYSSFYIHLTYQAYNPAQDVIYGGQSNQSAFSCA